jgi:hypothetical protein
MADHNMVSERRAQYREPVPLLGSALGRRRVDARSDPNQLTAVAGTLEIPAMKA